MRPLARRQLLRTEWPLLALALLALVVWLSPPQRLERINHMVQDAGLRLHQSLLDQHRHRLVVHDIAAI